MHMIKTSLLLSLLAAGANAQVDTSTLETNMEDITSGAGVETQNTDNQDVERVEVTGSLIKRVDVEGPSAVQTLDKEYIQNTGWNNLGDVMRDLSVNTFGVNPDSGGSSVPSSQFANLRGLGADRTLVLIDGRIAPKDAAQAAFDMSLIPIAAVERIDIMKDAGSALYGTDALGGVMNIITKKDYNGTELSQSHFQSEDKGGNRSTVGVTYGNSSSKGNITTSFQVRYNQKIKSKDRVVTSNGLSSNTPSANYSTPTGSGGNFENSCENDPSGVLGANGSCSYRYSDIMDETPDIKQVSNITNFNYDINSNTSVFGTTLASYKETEYIMAPGVVRMTLDGTTAINNLGLTNHNANDPVTIKWRSTQLGNRVTNSKDTTVGANVGVKRYIGDTWEASVIAGHSTTIRDSKNPNGYSNLSMLKSDIEDGTINPFNNTGTISDELRHQPFQKTQADLSTFEVRATGDVANGWAGPIGMAVGAGYNYEQIDIAIDAESLANNVSGGGASNAGAGTRASQFAVAEVAVPITKKLEGQLAARFDYYDGFGETFNPKLALGYRPFSNLLLRGSVGTGFKAPNMKDLFAGQEGYPWINDHSTGRFTQFQTRYAPNPNLKPETSRNIALGIVAEPTSFLSFNIDYFDNKINDQVFRPTAQVINDDERDLGREAAEAKWGYTGTRDPITGDPLYTITFINAHEIIQRGLDFGMKASGSLGKLGRISFSNDASYLFKYTIQATEDSEVGDFLGTRGQPEWRNRATLAYSPTQRLGFDLAATTTGSSFKQDPTNGKLKMYTRFDLAATIGLFDNAASLRVGVQDLVSDTPPVDFEAAGDEVVRELYDYTGRRFFASYRHTF